MNEDALQEMIIKGIQAGGLEAIRKARLTNTNMIIWREGKIVEITPDEAEVLFNEREAEEKPQ